jgi:hypothetical protein
MAPATTEARAPAEIHFNNIVVILFEKPGSISSAAIARKRSPAMNALTADRLPQRGVRD